MEVVTHEFAPVFDRDSRILVLGTIPSPKSREQGFYYGHPQNRFWRTLADVFQEPRPESIEEKRALALKHHVAIWDVLASCSIRGADDNSIREPIVNDMSVIFREADIRAVFTTGNKATALYRRYCEPQGFLPCTGLPSTSPANCRMSYEELLAQYMTLRQQTEEAM